MPAPTTGGYVGGGGNHQAAENGWEITALVLEKSSAKQGFGIAITGGADNPHHSTGDVSIIVSDIVKGSPADGTLRVGDILVSVNEKVVEGRTHSDAVSALKAAGMQARMQVKRPAPKQKTVNNKSDNLNDSSTDGRARKKPREMEQESGERKRSSRSRSRNREGEDGEKNGEKKRSRSRSRNREGEEGKDGEKPRRSRSKHREGEEGENKPRRSRSRGRDAEKKEGEEGEDKPKRSHSRGRDAEKKEGEEGEEDKPKRSRSRGRPRDAEKEGEEGEKKRSHSRGRSKSRSRDDLTRSKSKESLHRSKSKTRENLNGLPAGSEVVNVVLERSPQGYGFSLGQHIFIRDLAKESPAAKCDKLEKGDVVTEINGTPVANLKISDCIEIIKGAAEQLTLSIIKKPKEAVDQTDKPKHSKPIRPAEAPEAEIVKKTKKEEPVHKEPEPSIEVPVIKEPEQRDRSPPRDQHNDTVDSWSAASPEKRYQSQPQPNQEVENMDAKLERLKAGRKFERRISEFPNARVISFHKTGSVGIQVAGGNAVGIFVAAIRPDTAAAKEGLKPGDQIIMCNEIDFGDITREEAVLILLALPDDVSLIVESKKETFDQIKKDLGDNFFIRANFDHVDKANTNELTFRKGEIFNVRDTMYQGLIGYWQAQRVGKNAQMLERGVLPNKSRAEQLAIAQKMEDRQASTPGRSKVKRRGSIGGTLKKHKFVSQDHLDESSFAEGVQIPAYERVVLKVADFMRPVVILGALGDLIRFKLLEEMPDRFDVPTPMDIGGQRNIDRPYSDIKISEIRNVIAKNKHCLLDITPEGIEMLMYAQLCPIVIILKSPSRGVVKDMRASLVNELRNSPTGVPGFEGDPLNAKQMKRVFSNAKKLEEFYPHIFTAKINTHIAGGDVLSREFYYKLKEIIFTQQAQSAWMPEEKPAEIPDDMVFHPPNYMSYMSGADSDTEGESTTSSPVLARRHFEDDESPLPSPSNEEPPYVPPVEPERKHKRDRSRDKKDREESSDRESRRNRKSKQHKPRDEPEEREEDAPPSFIPEQPPYREPPQPEYKEDPPYREPPRDAYREPPSREDYREPPRDEYREPPRDEYNEPPRDDHREPPRNDYREPPRNDYREPPRDDYRDDYRSSPKNGYREPPRNEYREAPDYNYRAPPRDDYHDYRKPPPQVEEQISSQQMQSTFQEPDNTTGYMYGNGPDELQEDDIPVLRDPNYEMPKPVPDSPPTRRPPDIRPKPAANAIKVFPSELANTNSMDEKRKSLKRVSDNHNEAENDLPPYRPPPPAAEKEEVPTKVMTLQERMSKFQQKVTTTGPPPPKPTYNDEPPPPARPAAPRNYIVDSRNRGQQPKQAQNTYKPSAQFPEVKRVTPKPKPIEETYANVRNVAQDESEPPSRPRHPAGYDYVKPYNNKKDYTPQSPTHDYDYPRQPSHDYDYPSTGVQEESHYRNPPSSKNEGYSVPTSSYRDKPQYRENSYDEDFYPSYQLPNTSSLSSPSRNGHDPHSSKQGEEEPKVIATARGVFDHRGGLLESTETNVSIYIPAGALPEGKKQEVYFKVCQDSKYMPPLDSNSGETLLSPLVMCGPHGLKFRKPIELRLPHKGASNDSMAFSLKSSDSPVGHPGQWRNVKLGGKDLDSGRAYQVTDDTVSVLVDHF